MDKELEQIQNEVKEITLSYEKQINELCEKYKHRYLHILCGSTDKINTLCLHISVHAIPSEVMIFGMTIKQIAKYWGIYETPPPLSVKENETLPFSFIPE